MNWEEKKTEKERPQSLWPVIWNTRRRCAVLSPSAQVTAWSWRCWTPFTSGTSTHTCTHTHTFKLKIWNVMLFALCLKHRICHLITCIFCYSYFRIKHTHTHSLINRNIPGIAEMPPRAHLATQSLQSQAKGKQASGLRSLPSERLDSTLKDWLFPRSNSSEANLVYRETLATLGN